MAGPLSFLENMPREEIAVWLRKALLGKAHVPRDYPDEGTRSAIMGAEPVLENQTRRDIAYGVAKLAEELCTGSHRRPDYVATLMGLVADLKLIETAGPLKKLAETFVEKGKSRLTYAAKNSVLFALVNLPIPQPRAFWLKIWESNPEKFSPVTLAALFDLDPFATLELMPHLPDDEDLADTLAINLDYYSDEMESRLRYQFRRNVKELANTCQSMIRDSICSWLSETEDVDEVKSNSPLIKALLGVNLPVERTSAILVAPKAKVA